MSVVPARKREKWGSGVGAARAAGAHFGWAGSERERGPGEVDARADGSMRAGARRAAGDGEGASAEFDEHSPESERAWSACSALRSHVQGVLCHDFVTNPSTPCSAGLANTPVAQTAQVDLSSRTFFGVDVGTQAGDGSAGRVLDVHFTPTP